MLDQHIINLINADLDGELGADEARELKSILDSSSEAVSFRDELLQLNNAIAKLPELDPPARLGRTILDQVQLPARRGLFQFPGFLSDFNPATAGLAFAAGLLMAIGFYQIASQKVSQHDMFSMVGTMVGGEQIRAPGKGDRLTLEMDGLSGTVALNVNDYGQALEFNLESKVAIVTGASRGLGRAAAIALADQGASVLAVARSFDELQLLESEFAGKIKACECDMSDLEAVSHLPGKAIGTFGQLDIVVNNAGIAPAGPFLKQDDQTWHDVIAINITAPALLAKEAGKHLVSRGSGKIINIASTSGVLGKPLLVAYSASKGALLQFTKALAGEWARFGIQVNAIAPGAFATDAQRMVLESPDILARRLGKIPLKRMGETDEIGPMICYLASPLSDFVTGSVFVMDGGESSKL